MHPPASSPSTDMGSKGCAEISIIRVHIHPSPSVFPSFCVSFEIYPASGTCAVDDEVDEVYRRPCSTDRRRLTIGALPLKCVRHVTGLWRKFYISSLLLPALDPSHLPAQDSSVCVCVILMFFSFITLGATLTYAQPSASSARMR